MHKSAAPMNDRDDMEFLAMLAELESASDEWERWDILETYGYGDELEFA